MSQRGRVLVTGASGLIGGRLVPKLLEERWRVRAPTRDPQHVERFDPGTEVVGWDGIRLPDGALDTVTHVIHLAGEPVFAGRLTAARRQRIRDSRVESTRALAAAITALEPSRRPRVFACASAVGFYGSRGDDFIGEDAEPGSDFLADVCVDWEAAARGTEKAGVRVVCLRIGLVLAREGGALPLMALPFRFGLGGTLGSGRQWVPWIHADDAAGLFAEALDNEDFRGPVNAVAPTPVRNRELTRALADTLNRPALFTAPAFALRALLGELAEELLASRRVVPQRASEAGYEFAVPDLESALDLELSANRDEL